MRILLVEDNASVRQSLMEFLISLEYSVDECADGREALDFLEHHHADLVLSDVQMPNMTGHDLLVKIKSSKKLKHIAVILITGYGDIRHAVQMMREGAYDYLLKPVNILELDAVLKRYMQYRELEKAHHELKHSFNVKLEEATRDIQRELVEIRKVFAEQIGTVKIGIYSNPMRRLLETAEKLHASPDIPVLIEGETGTGKELIAHYIHFGKGDSITPFVGLNCAALTASLFESELFGYEPGAFTGGQPKGQKGKLELAQHGSLFLDEITEMPVEHQAKLLRVIQEREYFGVGGVKPKSANCRFICATNQPIQTLVREGRFRQDLFYRLNIGYLRIPPLRERREEILPLAQLFLDQIGQRKKTKFRDIHPDACEILETYSWPGNVRELKNVIERIILYWDEEVMLPVHFQSSLNLANPEEEPFQQPINLNKIEIPERPIRLNEITLEIVRQALERFGNNQTRTAQYLGISVRVLHTYLKKLSL